jgi:hypothetical protein
MCNNLIRCIVYPILLLLCLLIIHIAHNIQNWVPCNMINCEPMYSSMLCEQDNLMTVCPLAAPCSKIIVRRNGTVTQTYIDYTKRCDQIAHIDVCLIRDYKIIKTSVEPRPYDENVYGIMIFQATILTILVIMIETSMNKDLRCDCVV